MENSDTEDGYDNYFLKSSPKKFQFDSDITNVYDNMIERSVPLYKEIITSSIDIIHHHIPENGKIVDIGCATGNFEKELFIQYPNNNYKVNAYDTSPHMIDKAKKKLSKYNSHINFFTEDINTAEEKNVDCFISNYTLQFIEKKQRYSLLKNIHNTLNEKGFLILSEKIHSTDFDYDTFYHNFKKKNNYRQEEIDNKKKSLKKVLTPLTIKENIDLLKQTSFKKITTLFQYYCFVTFIAFKNE